MKVLFLFLFFISSLFANSKETCYTVQLLSKASIKNSINIDNYPVGCKSMIIGKKLAVRCGCFNAKKDAEIDLKELKSKYKNAIVMSTYKYRFDDNEVKQKVKNKQIDINKFDEDDGELRLILQVFLYKGDLESAYKVATIGYEKYKKSYYWNQKMAEICKWTNRSARAMKHLRYIYSLKYDKKIEQELIDFGSASYQYEDIEELVVSKALHNPTEKNINLMILIYKKIGEPEKVVKILEKEYYRDTTNRMLITKALRLSLEIGDLMLAKKYVNIIEAKKPYSQKDGALIAHYYYINHHVVKAYKSLKYIDTFNITDEKDNIKYYELKSDLGWYLQDNLSSVKASKILLDLDKARLVDYERISYVYKKTDPKLVVEVEKGAFLKYKINYLFFTYATTALNNKAYDDLYKIIINLEKENSSLMQDSKYWIIKSKLYRSSNEMELAEDALQKALQLSPNDYGIKLMLIYYYIDTNNNKRLKLILMDMDENEELSSTFFLPMASAYFYLNNINKASYYTDKLIALNDAATTLMSFKFMQAYIYQAQNNHSAFIGLMREIVSSLKQQLKKNPYLAKQDLYLSNYLRASMDILDAEKFEKKLKAAKKYLTKANYREISYSWAIKNSADEKSLKIYHKIKKKALWLRFSNSLIFKNHSTIENLLNENLQSLSMGDASQAANKDGQKSLSQSIAFEGLLKNDANQNAYIQHLDLSKQRSDSLDIKVSYYNRNPLLQKYLKLKNSLYLSRAYYFYTELDYFKNQTLNRSSIVTVPKNTIYSKLGLKRIYDRGYIKADIGISDALKQYISYSLIGNLQLSTDLYSTLTLSKDITAVEGTQLLLGGKKDMLSLNISWTILNSTMINFLYKENRYNSQDNIYLGKGNYSRISVNQKIRNGYPDLAIGTFIDFGSYRETEGTRGVIDTLLPKIGNILPENFYNLGAIFSYGMANSSDYTRVWRPYFEFSPSYNSVSDAYSYSLLTGYGGKVFHQDHVTVGFSYTESLNGISGKSYEIYLNYKFLYKHPKI